MNINDTIHGFMLKSRDSVSEISATVNIFEHIKSGAKLCFIEREDRNLSFAISFATPPEDDTGVFHIIEHSVLCGSRKFPVKEPFVEMLKGSLNTFLNAMTYEDKTVYPVASRCEKDFYNLVDVYLDAVFHPLMLTDERIFMQEGWHLEPERDGGVSYNGVVFNEMCGAYSSPDELSGAELSRALFSGSPYGYDSGGRPDAIPDLTYEKFKTAHEKYYVPENALIVLDGSVDLEKTLSLIDGYLSEYEKCGFTVETVYPEARIAPRREVFFRASDEEDKPRLLYSGVFSRADDKLSSVAVTLLCDVLLGSNEAPLKKRLLSSGLCEDVSVYANKAALNTVTLELYGIAPELTRKIDDFLSSTLLEIITEGIDKKLLRATLDRLKFRLREKDLGAFPRGVANALSVLEGWHYGISPTELLTAEDSLSELEVLISSDYYEKLLRSTTLDSDHRASIVMLPSAVGDAVSRKLDEKIRLVYENITAEELEAVKLQKEALEKRQSTPDPEDCIALVPTLTLDDIKLCPDVIQTDVLHVSGVEVLRHKIETNGILYTELYFSAENLTEDELTYLTVISSLLTNLDTENYTALDLKTEIKAKLGAMSPIALSYTRVSDGGAIPLFMLKLSSLAEKADDLLKLSTEVLLRTKYNDPERLRKILTQIRSETEISVLSSGDGIATERVETALSASGRVNEDIIGLSAYKRIKAYEENFDSVSDDLIAEISSLAKRIFTRDKLLVSVAGEASDEFVREMISAFPRSDANEPSPVLPNRRDALAEGIKLPLNISHTALGLCSKEVRDNPGVFKVAQTILSYEYLWGQIRVLGGAYGAGMVSRRYGGVVFSSYRDPNPKESIETFRRSADFLREFLLTKPNLTKYIIGAIGEYDVMKTPRMMAAQAAADHITGWTKERERALVDGILSCDEASLMRSADILAGLMSSSSFAVVADADTLSEFEGINVIAP